MDNEKRVIKIKERPFKVGDKVWDACNGIGTVIEFADSIFPLRIDFCGFQGIMGFTADGCLSYTSTRTLFHYDIAEQAGLIDMEIEIVDKAEFKPEKSKLYYRPESSEVLEYVDGKTYFADCGMNIDYKICHMVNAVEIREFDKFSTNSLVWINNAGKVSGWEVIDFSLIGEIETISITDSCQKLTIDYNGNALGLPLKFYRNEFRAQRLGR